MTVMIVLPPAVVTERTVNDAVKVPVAVVGGVACANGVSIILLRRTSFDGLIYSRVRSDFRFREVFL